MLPKKSGAYAYKFARDTPSRTISFTHDLSFRQNRIAQAKTTPTWRSPVAYRESDYSLGVGSEAGHRSQFDDRAVAEEVTFAVLIKRSRRSN